MKIPLEAAGHQRDPHAYIYERPTPTEMQKTATGCSDSLQFARFRCLGLFTAFLGK